ncbi:MAG: MaoC domain protein dehydratase [Bryobacterales bacterium]|nr:MaoC domain protein dehydratase [Bryobacterales bacterium]
MPTTCSGARERTEFASIQIGATAQLTETITAEQVEAFANLTGDFNALHMDAAFAQATNFRRRVVHGMVAASYVSQLIGTRLPGHGSLWTEQKFRWLAPVFIGDTLTVQVMVTAKSPGSNTISIEAKAVNQDDRTVMAGEGTVLVVEPREASRDVSLAERSALITGGSRGIGAAIAWALGSAGVKVTVLYRSSSGDAHELCERVRGVGGQALAVQADVTDYDAVSAAASRARDHFGKNIDVLINNAGIPFVPSPFLETAWGAVQQQLGVHVHGAFNCCQAVIPGMLDNRNGRIVNIGSMHSWSTPPAQWTGFAVAKAALKSLTRSLAAEFSSKGIRVNMVSPGMTETDFTASVPDRVRKVQAMQTPLRRLASAEDVAGAVVFLCSEQSSFLSGADIPVCGGSAM